MPDRTASSSSSLSKAFEVLDMFSLAMPVLHAEDLIVRRGYTRSTAYRYLKELCDAGLLAPFSSGAYSLGPRIIELERLLELTDPLYRAGREVLAKLAGDNRVYLLHNVYRDKVLCIYKEGPDVIEHGGRRIVVRRARGLPFPLFQGAGSLALLAFMTPHRIRQIYLRSAEEIARAGLGADWEAFRGNLAAIRRRGYATSAGTITPLLGGIAVPIMLPNERKLIGSLARTVPSDVMREETVAAFAAELKQACAAIGAAYASAGTSILRSRK